eukprot:CAMPEP_0119297956 /NCGR_PEP_ID=MMETSP1333-20130426/155_1 /TAXON_ID=418940 /ORGANISM="Scyphosphaera apsteinii, Strain RCC1455" /LENGTH=321 /DNA_ID=CAMNT_0007298931 /DNA_START=325 /DNA_END=1286 /DNA_ORIENTATION=-
MHFYCMQLSKLQLDLLEHDYGRRRIMVPRSGSVKIFELQSTLALKCASRVEQEDIVANKAATIQSFKQAVAGVCPSQPTHRIRNRKIAGAMASVGNQPVERIVGITRDVNECRSTGGIQVMLPSLEPPPEPHHKAQPPRLLDPTANPFVLRRPPCTRARARRNRRQRSDRRRPAAATPIANACTISNSKERRAARRKPKREAWQSANVAEPLQDGLVMQVRLSEQLPQSVTPQPMSSMTMPSADNALSVKAELSLAASREKREARREAQAESDEWCGRPGKSIFDVLTPPCKFIDGWYSRYTPHIGGSPFGAQPLNVFKLR